MDEDGDIGRVLSLIQRLSDAWQRASTDGEHGSRDTLVFSYALLYSVSRRYEANWTTRTKYDHAADESDRPDKPDKVLQQRLISVNGIRRGFEWRGFEWPVFASVHRAAQLLKAGTTYQARKARMARTMMTIAVYLIAEYPARPDDSGSGLWV